MRQHELMKDVWAVGDSYERYVGRWSRHVAPEFLRWLGIGPGRRWLDVGCGTGALTKAILGGCDPGSVTGVDPSPGFVAHCAATIDDERVTFFEGDATNLPDGLEVDVAVAGLVLNFVPDPPAAVATMRRAAADGWVAAYVWDYAGEMQMLRYFWDTAVALRADAAPAAEAVRFAICDPDRLDQLWRQAGLSDVETRPIDVPTVFADFDDYWAPFLLGQGPAPVYVANLDESDRAELAAAIKDALPTAADGSIALTARAWAVRGAA
jgi:SAM-dependent methyltransferase